MVYVPSTATCGTSGSSLPYMNELLTIYKWPGVKGGCVSSQGSIKAGACSGTQNMVNERGAVDLNFWQTRKFCAYRTPVKDLKYHTWKQKAESCTSGFTACNDCQCFATMSGDPTAAPPLQAYKKCPISDWIFFKGTKMDLPVNTQWSGHQINEYNGNAPVKWIQF